MKTPARVSVLALCIAVSATSSIYATDAAALWRSRCSKCHGEDGRGDTKMGHKLYINDLTGTEIQSKFTDEDATKSIKFGLKDANGKVIMKAVNGLSDDEVKALVAHVRSLKK